MDIDPPLQAMVSQDEKLKLKISCVIRDQKTRRGRLSLIKKIHEARPNIDDIRRWAKFKWKLQGNLYMIALPNNYMLFVFNN